MLLSHCRLHGSGALQDFLAQRRLGPQCRLERLEVRPLEVVGPCGKTRRQTRVARGLRDPHHVVTVELARVALRELVARGLGSRSRLLTGVRFGLGPLAVRDLGQFGLGALVVVPQARRDGSLFDVLGESGRRRFDLGLGLSQRGEQAVTLGGVLRRLGEEEAQGIGGRRCGRLPRGLLSLTPRWLGRGFVRSGFLVSRVLARR